MKISHLSLPQYFGRDQRGIAAVEFAMMLPLMLTLYVGTVEISQAVGIDRKVTLTTRTVADLASQVTSINNTDMTNLLQASTAVIMPYDATKLKVTVSQVDIDATTGNATIKWSDTLGGTAHGAGSAVTLPAALNIKGNSLIWSEVSYSYTPPIGQNVIQMLGLPSGTINLSDQIYMAPRLSSTVSRVP